MKEPVKILNFGSLNIDKIYNLDHIVNEGETLATISYKESLGGKGLNQTIALKRAGVDVYHAGFVGEVDGEILLNYLRDNKIKSMIKKTSGNSGHAIIQVDKNANNSIIVEAGANKKIGKAYADEVLEKFSKGDFLLLQNEINSLQYIVDQACKKDMRIFFNPSPIDDNIKSIDLNKIDTIIINQNEGSSLSGFVETFEILNYFKENFPKLKVVLTLGRLGGVYSYKNEEIRFKSHKVKALDTTAAGDTFLGYYLASIASGLDIEESLNLASLAAGLACTKEGAAPSIPSYKELEVYMKKNKVEI